MSKPLPNLLSADQNIQDEIRNLGNSLDQEIPAKTEQNILIGTWNIKKFGRLNENWTSDGKPKRDYRALRAITDIVKRFDVVAIQEITGDLLALRTMMKTLGKEWSFIMTDVARGDSGNSERLGFVFHRPRVKLSGLAAELVIPRKWKKKGIFSDNAMESQFARTPYAVSFVAGRQTFILVTVHIDYASAVGGREKELRGIAQWMRSWARQTTRWSQNLLVLGDFNIDRKNDKLWKAFTGTGLRVPEELEAQKRSIFADENNKKLEKYYDQIAWFTSKSTKKDYLTMKLVSAGGFDFLPFLYNDLGLTKLQIQHRMSDHYPLWVEFRR